MVKIAVGAGALALAYLAGLRVGSEASALYLGLGVLLMVVAVASWRS